MRNEVGSFFEEEESSDRESSWWTDMFGRRDALYTASGREAIELAIIAAENSRSNLSKVCLLPQYTCDTVILPFQKHNWEIYFYPVDTSLEISEEILAELLNSVDPGLLLMHTYFGTDTIKGVRHLIADYQRERGLVFVEDMTQSLALLSQVQGADYYVGSIRKWFAIPDGGFILGENLPQTECFREKSVFVEKKMLAQRLKADYLQEKGDVSKEEFLRINREAEDYLYQDVSVCKMSEISYKRLQCLDGKRQLRQREKNGVVLSEQLEKCKSIRAMIEMRGQSPLYLPILTEHREKLQELLREHDIFAPVLWPVPKEVEDTMTQDVRYIFEHMLALPCDHRYLERDMCRIGEILLKYEERCKTL